MVLTKVVDQVKGVGQDFKENVKTSYEVARGDDVEVENNTTGETLDITRRKLGGSLLASIFGWEGAKEILGAAQTVGSSAASGAGKTRDWIFGDDEEYNLRIVKPEGGERTGEDTLAYKVDFEASDDAVYDILAEGNNIESGSFSGERTETGSYSLEGEPRWVDIKAGLSPRDDAPEERDDVTNHKTYGSASVYFDPVTEEEDPIKEPENDENGYEDPFDHFMETLSEESSLTQDAFEDYKCGNIGSSEEASQVEVNYEDGDIRMRVGGAHDIYIQGHEPGLAASSRMNQTIAELDERGQLGDVMQQYFDDNCGDQEQ